MACICVSILVIFFKINFVAETRISLLIYEREEWEIVSEFDLLLNAYYECDKKDMKFLQPDIYFKILITMCLPNPCITYQKSVGTTQSTLNYEYKLIF